MNLRRKLPATEQENATPTPESICYFGVAGFTTAASLAFNERQQWLKYFPPRNDFNRDQVKDCLNSLAIHIEIDDAGTRSRTWSWLIYVSFVDQLAAHCNTLLPFCDEYRPTLTRRSATKNTTNRWSCAARISSAGRNRAACSPDYTISIKWSATCRMVVRGRWTPCAAAIPA